ncbi:Uma2 family endonuclease [Planktothrix agardhii]|uniref:Uma2 family endonuclease n=1 Tax=Planktothrix agardhii TaxID=1160 RepID=UPI0029F547B0|nr:Uma2 family endonuclease [Planktothrix agardhii]
MIAVKGKFPKLTPEEYFIWEEKQLLRHEYLSGRVYAMSGGTQNHGRIASNIIFILKGHLRGVPGIRKPQEALENAKEVLEDLVYGYEQIGKILPEPKTLQVA